MTNADAPGCAIYFEADKPISDVAATVASAVHGTARAERASVEVCWSEGQIEIRRNPDARPELIRDFPDGFVYFQGKMEICFSPESILSERVASVCKVLDSLWALAIPAVAACDFEEQLPRHGGYKDQSVPWPGKPGKQARPSLETQKR